MRKNHHALFSKKVVCSLFLKQQTYVENCNGKTGCRLTAKKLLRTVFFAGQAAPGGKQLFFAYAGNARQNKEAKELIIKSSAPERPCFYDCRFAE
ncbi:hypothetical protein [Niabella sp.]|uniref:hypothetical protein n=1 Tax=Niabella sp. TaxID=1962976 RepID=UPI002630E2B8|nr:hypothetical protein [Niabella sp.]